jgi:hypothetical protein
VFKLLATTLSISLFAVYAHAGYTVYANGTAFTNNLAPPTAVQGYDAGQKSSANVDLFTDSTYDDSAGHTGYASSALKIKAELGQLHFLASVYATNNYYPGFDGGYAGFGYDDRSPKVAALAGFADVLTPTSATLPVGTPVEFAVHMTLEGTRTADAVAQTGTVVDLRANFYANDYTSLLEMPMGTSVQHDDFIVHGQIGYEMPFGSYFQAYGNTAVTHGGASFTTVDAWNTGSMTFAPVDPNVSFTTSSGYRYQAVPEPSVFAALGLGLIAILRRRRG